MNLKKVYLSVILLLFSCTLAFSQIPPPKKKLSGPPPPSMPSDSNRVLIDKIIKVTNHEAFFIDYCTKAVKTYGYKNEWDAETILARIELINFSSYSRTIYNSYASYSSEELKALLEVMVIINKNKRRSSTMILQNSMMQSNLDLYVSGLL